MSLILVLITVIVVLNRNGRMRGLPGRGLKAVALMMESREQIFQYEEESGRSYFSQKEQNNWYVPYMDYRYEKKILSEDLTKPSAAEAQIKRSTYERGQPYSGGFFQTSGSFCRIGEEKPNANLIRKRYFWQFYDKLLEETGAGETEYGVRTLEVLLYGTPANVQPSESWTAYTMSEGHSRFEGLALDAYIDWQTGNYGGVRNEEMICCPQGDFRRCRV